MNDDEWPGMRFAREAVCKSTTQGEYDLNARLLRELLHPLTPEMRDVYESNPGLRFARVAVLKSTEEGEYAVHARMFQELLQTRVQSQPEQENTSSPGAVNAVDPEVQAEVDALAVQIMEAAEQRKKNKDRLELLLSTEDQRKNDQSEQTMYTRDTSKTDPATCSTPGLEDLAMLENFVPEIGPKRKYGTGSVVCRKYTSGRERWEAVIGQNKKRKQLGLYDTKVEAENACDSYLEDPDGFVRPPLLKRRKGTGSVVCTKYTSGRERWRVVFIQNKERKDLGLYDTKEEAENARGRYLEDPEGFVVPPLLCGTGKTNPVTSSTSGLKDLAMVAALEQPESSKRPRSDDEEDVEKFTDFEIGHLVFARVGKANWAPAQISAISTSTRGHQVYDVEFFVKEKNGVYPCAQNLPLSKLEAADKDTFEKHSGRRKSKNWVEGMEEFRRLYDKSRRV